MKIVSYIKNQTDTHQKNPILMFFREPFEALFFLLISGKAFVKIINESNWRKIDQMTYSEYPTYSTKNNHFILPRQPDRNIPFITAGLMQELPYPNQSLRTR